MAHLAAVTLAASAGSFAMAAAVILLLCRAGRRLGRRQRAAWQDPEQGATEGRDDVALLEEVRRRSAAVWRVVTTKDNDRFSVAGLKKYLKMKGISVFEGASPEETVTVNAARLVAFLDQSGAAPVSARTAPRLRHELVSSAIAPTELHALFPAIKDAYVQQPLDYGRNSRYGDKWRISCYVVVMENWKPKIEPHLPMVTCMTPVMDQCVKLFNDWYCRRRALQSVEVSVMNAFVTRYRPIEDEDQLKKHIDGANVDGSVILALPTDDPFVGGGLHVWDGRPQEEFVYQMQPGDALFLENAVWHQAKPITFGTRWALVLFLRLRNAEPLDSSSAG